MNNKQDKLHWYLFAYKGKKGNSECYGHTMVAYTHKELNKQNIRDAIQYINSEPNLISYQICIISINYLGCMTKDEFDG